MSLTDTPARRFYSQAIADLDTARDEVRPRRYYAAVFFAEQAEEEGLKAAHWHLLAEEPPWTHQMDRVAASVAEKSGGMHPGILLAISELMSGLERSRYPSGNVDEPIPVELVDETNAKAAVGHAEAVMAWVDSLRQQPMGKPKRRRS